MAACTAVRAYTYRPLRRRDASRSTSTAGVAHGRAGGQRAPEAACPSTTLRLSSSARGRSSSTTPSATALLQRRPLHAPRPHALLHRRPHGSASQPTGSVPTRRGECFAPSAGPRHKVAWVATAPSAGRRCASKGATRVRARAAARSRAQRSPWCVRCGDHPSGERGRW